MITDEQIQELQWRNMQRVKEAIEKLGTKYLCHPANKVKKLKRKQTALKGTA